jgi:hypothetical protein
MTTSAQAATTRRFGADRGADRSAADSLQISADAF